MWTNTNLVIYQLGQLQADEVPLYLRLVQTPERLARILSLPSLEELLVLRE